MEKTQSINNKSQLAAPAMPWKTRIALSIASAVTDASRRSNGTVNRRLLRILEYNYKTSPSPTKPINGVTSSDITIDASRNLWFRLFIPTTATQTSLPVFVFFHGGGFVYLSPDNPSYDGVCRVFARKLQMVVISVNYRLAPEHKYPAQYDDGLDVLKFIDDATNSGRFLPGNSDLSCCFLGGDSAGANIAHHVAKRACESGFRQLKVIGVAAIQPFFGGEERTEAEITLEGVDQLVNTSRTDWMWKAFMTPGMDRNHEVINVSGPRAADISQLDFPAVLVVVGGFDSLQEWQRRYYEWLKRSGKEAYLVEYPNMVHAFYVFPQFAESKQLVSELKDFMTKQISKVANL